MNIELDKQNEERQLICSKEKLNFPSIDEKSIKILNNLKMSILDLSEFALKEILDKLSEEDVTSLILTNKNLKIGEKYLAERRWGPALKVPQKVSPEEWYHRLMVPRSSAGVDMIIYKGDAEVLDFMLNQDEDPTVQGYKWGFFNGMPDVFKRLLQHKSMLPLILDEIISSNNLDKLAWVPNNLFEYKADFALAVANLETFIYVFIRSNKEFDRNIIISQIINGSEVAIDKLVWLSRDENIKNFILKQVFDLNRENLIIRFINKGLDPGDYVNLWIRNTNLVILEALVKQGYQINEYLARNINLKESLDTIFHFAYKGIYPKFISYPLLDNIKTTNYMITQLIEIALGRLNQPGATDFIFNLDEIGWDLNKEVYDKLKPIALAENKINFLAKTNASMDPGFWEEANLRIYGEQISFDQSKEQFAKWRHHNMFLLDDRKLVPLPFSQIIEGSINRYDIIQGLDEKGRIQINVPTREEKYKLEPYGSYIKTLKDLPPIKKSKTFNEFKIFLAEDGTIWILGEDDNGLAGLGEQNTKNRVPIKNPYLKDIVDFSASWAMVVYLDKNGRIYVCGFNGNEQYILTPKLVRNVNNVKAVHTYYYFYPQTYIVDENNIIQKVESLSRNQDEHEISAVVYSNEMVRNSKDVIAMTNSSDKLFWLDKLGTVHSKNGSILRVPPCVKIVGTDDILACLTVNGELYIKKDKHSPEKILDGVINISGSDDKLIVVTDPIYFIPNDQIIEWKVVLDYPILETKRMFGLMSSKKGTMKKAILRVTLENGETGLVKGSYDPETGEVEY